MRATFRPLPTWPYPPRPKATVPFRSGWEDTLDKLEAEVAAKGGTDVVIGIVCDESQISLSGMLKAGGRTSVRHPGAEVSFELKSGQRVVFHTDAYATLTHNLRAIRGLFLTLSSAEARLLGRRLQQAADAVQVVA